MRAELTKNFGSMGDRWEIAPLEPANIHGWKLTFP